MAVGFSQSSHLTLKPQNTLSISLSLSSFVSLSYCFARACSSSLQPQTEKQNINNKSQNPLAGKLRYPYQFSLCIMFLSYFSFPLPPFLFIIFTYHGCFKVWNFICLPSCLSSIWFVTPHSLIVPHCLFHENIVHRSIWASKSLCNFWFCWKLFLFCIS